MRIRFITIIILTFLLLKLINMMKNNINIFDDRILVLSTVDNSYYKVRKSKQQKKVANRLAICKSKMNRILSHTVETREGSEIDRLKLKAFEIPIEELSQRYEGEAAYSVNKGARIGICVKDKRNEFEDENTMIFVLCHEYAHVMTNEWGHTEKFWKNMKILLQVAEEIGVYEYQNYNKKTENYCGHEINSTPYKKTN